MRLPVDNDFPFVGGINAGKNLDQRTFAASVLTGKAVDFRGTNREVDVVQGTDPSETLAYTEHLDECGSRLRRVVPGQVR